MPAAEMTVGAAGRKDKRSNVERWPEQAPWIDVAPSVEALRRHVAAHVEELVSLVDGSSTRGEDYESFERTLVTDIFTLGRLLIALFLALSEARTEVPKQLKRGRARYRRQPPKGRWLGTYFGKVRYWRSYMHQTNGRGGGYYPLDQALGLTADGFSLGVLSRAVLLATKMSFAAAATTMTDLLGWSPSTKTIEQATLGLGRHTTAWFEQAAPPPSLEGDVLVIEVDSKATPTATEEELAKRRGEREPNPHPESARHRGRSKRKRRGPKKRRKKGDKSKNGKATTVVTMYTLRPAVGDDGKVKLLGPLNRWIYASYAPKRHALAIARREADKRGFATDSGRTTQIVSDGDEDLERYVADLFPEAIHTPDVIHCVEYLWKAAGCLYKEGSETLSRWVAKRKEELYGGRVWEMLETMNDAASRIRHRKRRERYGKYLDYLLKRAHRMNYAELAERDLELSSGAIEGAVRYVVSQRFDEGGMRWIRERAEPLLQLRCIQINGDWDQFVAFAHQRALRDQATHNARLAKNTPEPLPTFGLAA
jgi:hypothetical protein